MYIYNNKILHKNNQYIIYSNENILINYKGKTREAQLSPKSVSKF